jgi:glycosyltransferase involved in cell wall biosynthesis
VANLREHMSAVTLAHHWLVTYRGGEKVLAEFRHLFPSAPLASLICQRGKIPEAILGQDVITSPLQLVPGAARYYKALLPLHAWSFEQLSAPTGTRLVLSSDAAMVKGLQLPLEAKQVCYCHSPPRYLWDMQTAYTQNSGELGLVGRMVFNWAVPRTRAFDFSAAQRVDRFIANSSFVAERINRCYGRDSEIIYPPVAINDFAWDRPSEDFYLLVTQLTPYKRADLAVRAFSAMGKRLVVIGEGSEFKSLRKIAGPSVELLGHQPFTVVKDHFERCRAFICPQVEDFGITVVEAQAAGKPVIAIRAGGALETVIEGETGIFFDEQTPESLIDAVQRFEAINDGLIITGSKSWARPCRANAERYRPERFRSEIKSFLMQHYSDLLDNYVWPE